VSFVDRTARQSDLEGSKIKVQALSSCAEWTSSMLGEARPRVKMGDETDWGAHKPQR
jgi:hypothetical protein